MNLSDALAHYGWQLTVWLAVGGLSVIAAGACGFTIGRHVGLDTAPTVWRERSRRVAWRMSLVVVRWQERWKAERHLRETAEDRERVLRGAGKAYTDALREAV